MDADHNPAAALIGKAGPYGSIAEVRAAGIGLRACMVLDIQHHHVMNHPLNHSPLFLLQVAGRHSKQIKPPTRP